MLSRTYQKLRLNSKGNLKRAHSNAKGITPSRLLPGIPVLSISALLVVFACAVHFNCDATHATSESITPRTATSALTITGAGNEEVVSAGRGTTVYRAHTITATADGIENYRLTISGDSELKSSDGTTIPGTSDTKGNALPEDTWGYGWGSASDAELTYHTPTTTNTTLATSNATNYQLNLTNRLIFAAKFSQDTPPGNYRANVTLSLTVTPATLTTYTITYDANGGTGTPPTAQTADSYDPTYTFTAATQGNLTRSGHQFLGWSESSTGTTATYTADSTISLTTSNPTKTLYAVWEKLNGITTVTKMQDLYTGNNDGISQICTNSTIGDTNTLTDSRDGNTYTVRKHADGNCWMTQNLRLVGPLSLTPSNSNVTSNYTLPSSSVSGYNSSYLYLSQMYYGNNITRGAYYSFTAATAGTGNADLSTGDATSSICPKGWVLPSNTDYRTLLGVAGYNTTTMQSPPYNFVIAGFVVDGSNTTGSEGDYWTRTAGGAHGFRLNFNTTGIDVNVYYRSCGFSVRCVAYSS